MKRKLLVAVMLVAISVAMHAQTGSILVGGNVSITSVKTPSTPSDTKSTAFEFNPTVGYQFHENWTTGVTAKIQSTKYNGAVNTTTRENIFGAGPFIRYSKNLSGIFSVYGQLQGIFGSDKIGSAKSSFANINAFPAIFINVHNGFGLNFSVGGISYNSSKPSGGRASNVFQLTFGQSVNIGISKNFGTRSKK